MKLKTESLSVKFGRRPILNDINLTLEKGEKIAVIGPNGAGKTTFLRAVNQMIDYDGSVTLDGRCLRRMNWRHRAKLLAWLPQKPWLPPGLSVFDAVLMGATPYLSLFSHPGRQEHDQASHAIEVCGLQALQHRQAHTLSGGELQTVFLARSILQNTCFLLLDEPCAHLDFAAAYRMIDRINRFVRLAGVGAIATMHDPNLTLAFADKIVAIDRQKIIARLNSRKDGFLEGYLDSLNSIYQGGVEMIFHQGRPLITIGNTGNGD